MDIDEAAGDLAGLQSEDSYILARLITKTPKFSVPDTTYSLLSRTDVADLNNLLNNLLTESGNEEESTRKPVEFDFLINGEVLIRSVGEFIQSHGISAEDVIVIEYIERLPAPLPDRIIPHSDWISALDSISQFILSGSYDNTAKVFTTSGDLIVNCEAHSAPIESVAWISASKLGGTFLTSSHDQTICLWNWDKISGKHSATPKAIYRGHAGSVDCVAVNLEKTKFCSVSWDKMVKIWSLTEENQDEVFANDGPPEKRRKLDGKTLTRVPVATLSGHREAVSSCIWSNINEIMTASLDRTIRIWDVELGGISRELDATKAILSVAYSPLNKLFISGGTDRLIRLYDPRSNEGSVVKMSFTSHVGWIPSVSWSPLSEHYFVSGSYDKLMKMWDVRNSKCPLYDMAGHTDKILSTCWTPSNLLLSGGADNELKIFRASV